MFVFENNSHYNAKLVNSIGNLQIVNLGIYKIKVFNESHKNISTGFISENVIAKVYLFHYDWCYDRDFAKSCFNRLSYAKQ